MPEVAAPVFGQGLQFTQPAGGGMKKPGALGPGTVQAPQFGVQAGPFSAGAPVAATPAAPSAGTPGSMTTLPNGGQLSSQNNFSPGVQPGPVQVAAPGSSSGAAGAGGQPVGGVMALPSGSSGNRGGTYGGNGPDYMSDYWAQQDRNAQQAQQFAWANSPMALLQEKAKLEQDQWQREMDAQQQIAENERVRNSGTSAGMAGAGAKPMQAPASTSTSMVWDPVLGTMVPSVQAQNKAVVGPDGTVSMSGRSLIQNPALDRLRDARLNLADESARSANIRNEAAQVRLNADREGALWNSANAGNNVDFSHSGDGVVHNITSGGGGGSGSRRSGTGYPENGYSIDEILSKFNTMLPQSPLPRETAPTAPAQLGEVAPVSVASRKAMNAANFGQAKDRIGRLSMSALRDVRNNMTGRGISGSGIEARLGTDTINAGYGKLGDVITAQAQDDAQIEQEVANLNANLQMQQRGQNLSQRGQDIGVAGQDYSGRISQRGQDAQTNQARFNSIMALINQYGGRLY